MIILITEIDMPSATYCCMIVLHCTLVTTAAALTIATAAVVSVAPLPLFLLFIL